MGRLHGDVAHDAGKARVVFANSDRYEGGVRQGLRHGVTTAPACERWLSLPMLL